MGKARHLAPLGQFLQPEFIFFVRSLDRHLQLLTQYVGRRAVVQVRVGQNDFLYGRVHIFHCRQDAVYITARVYNGRLAGRLTLDDGTVLLVGRHRHNRALNGHDSVGSCRGVRPWEGRLPAQNHRPDQPGD